MDAAWPRWRGLAQRFARPLRTLAALLLAALAAAPAPAPADEDPVPMTLDQARFERAGSVPRTVALPHTWALDGLGGAGRGRYRIDFELARAPTRPWALVAERLGSRHALRLNGALVQATLDASGEVRGVPAPAFVELPPALLRAGRNEIDVDVDHDFRAGLSALHLGPAEQVLPIFARTQTWIVTVPQTMNVVAAGLALFMLTIWLRRPSERELGFFCALMVAASLRNVISTGSGNLWHTVGADYLLYALQVASMVLLAHFAISFSGRDGRLLRRVVDSVALLLVTGGAWAAWHGAMTALRVYAYPLVLVLLLPSLWLLVVGARRARGARQAALTAAITLLVGAAVHDYFYLRGLLPVMDQYWMPFTSPLALLVFAWAQLDRLVGALGAVEGQAAQLERRVAERTRELERANAAKTRFIAAASHDLRQPVVSIGLLADLLRERPSAPAMQTLLDRLGDSVQALNALLKGLLDLSRFDAGAVPVRAARVALRPLLETVVDAEREAARRKGIALRLRVPPLQVHTDALLLEQILRNLVGNAVRYTERGGVLVGARRRGADRVAVQVWDTGIGIAPESQALVFEEFVQLDNDARERSRGLGLGLSIVKRAAALLGAPLALRSRPGRGSCFGIELPFAGPDPGVAAALPAPGTGLTGLRLWLVEDDTGVREALRLRLAGWGAQVRAFDGAVAAGDAIDANEAAPDLLVTDQRLPDGSGLVLARRLRARHAGAPVLVITGDTAPQDIAQLQASGLPLLHKPFAPDELQARVRVLVRPGAVRA